MSLPLRFTTPEELAERAGWSPRKVREISIEVHASFAPIFAMRLAIQVIPFSDDLRYIMQARQGESDLTSLSEPERKITANSHRADCPERVVRMVGVGGAIEPLKWFRSSHFCAILCRHSAARKDVRLTPELDVGTHHLAGGKVGRWISTCPAHGRTPSRNQARPECYFFIHRNEDVACMASSRTSIYVISPIFMLPCIISNFGSLPFKVTRMWYVFSLLIVGLSTAR